MAGRLEIAELFDVLLGPEVAFELRDEDVERAVERVGIRERTPEQVEARIEQRLLLAIAAAVS
jgi:hypothetical protein